MLCFRLLSQRPEPELPRSRQVFGRAPVEIGAHREDRLLKGEQTIEAFVQLFQCLFSLLMALRQLLWRDYFNTAILTRTLLFVIFHHILKNITVRKRNIFPGLSVLGGTLQLLGGVHAVLFGEPQLSLIKSFFDPVPAAGQSRPTWLQF